MLLRSTLIYAPAILLPRLSAVLLLIVTTRLVDQVEYGLLALVVTIGEMTDIAVSNWLRIALIRLGGSVTVLSGTLRKAGGVLALTTTAGVVIATGASIAVVPERWQEFSLAVGLYLVAGSISRFGLTTLQMQQRQTLFTLMEGLRSLLGIALPIAALILVEPTFLAASIASSVATAGVGVLTVILAARLTLPGAAPFRVSELLHLGAPLIVLAILSFALGSVERLFLKAFWDASAVALYVAAVALARQPVDVISNAINSGGFPELIRRFDFQGRQAAAAFIAEQMSLMAKLVFPAAAFLIALREDIVGLVLPAEYWEVSFAIFPLIVGGVLCMNFKTFVFDNVFNVFKRNWLQSASFLPGALAAVVLGFLIVPSLGALGAAYAFAGGAALSLLASIIASNRLMTLAVPYRDLTLAALVAVGTYVGAIAGSAAWGAEASALVRLIGGTAGGGLSFLALTALFNLEDARRWLRQVRGAG